MKRPSLILVALVLFAILVVAAFSFFRTRRQPFFTFRDVVTNLDRWNEIATADQRLQQEAKMSSLWSDSEVEAAVRSYVLREGGRDSFMGSYTIEELGVRAHPAVMRILTNSSLRPALVKPGGKDGSDTGFNRLYRLIVRVPPKDSALFIASYLNEPDERIRRDAAYLVGKIGSVETVVPLRKAFADVDAYVCNRALVGLMHSKSIEPACGNQIYDDVRKLFEGGTEVKVAAQVMLACDEKRASNFLLSGDVFNVNYQYFGAVLDALRERKILAPRARLLELVSELQELSPESGKYSLIGDVLCLLGQHQNPVDTALMEDGMKQSNLAIAWGAADGLLRVSGLGDFEASLYSAYEKKGWEALDLPQRYYLAVSDLDAEVNNGGFSQYFFNSSGDHWHEALVGLEAMGFSERLSMLREALVKFGVSGPSADRHARQEQLSELESKSKGLFNPLDDRYYKCKENVRVYGTRYVVKNLASFK